MDYMPEKFKGMELVAEPVEKVNVTLDGDVYKRQDRSGYEPGECFNAYTCSCDSNGRGYKGRG